MAAHTCALTAPAGHRLCRDVCWLAMGRAAILHGCGVCLRANLCNVILNCIVRKVLRVEAGAG